MACRRMLPSWLLLCVLIGSVASATSAQQAAHIAYDFPAGGRQGTNVVVVVGGQYLQSATGVHFSGDGVRGTVLSLFKPLTNKQFNDFRKELTTARQTLIANGARPGQLRMDNPAGMARVAHEAGLTDSELAAFVEYDRERRDAKRELNPGLAEKATVRVQIDPNASPGARELRLITAIGPTNWVHFVVGEMPEFVLSKPNTVSTTAISDELPVVLNGQILPGDIDRFTFHGHKGMSLVASCAARELMPYIADTVPGWFQASITLRDSKGKELAYADHFLYHPDPAFHCMLPADDDYTLEVHDALYRGREDFVYRVSLGEIPLLESIYPLGGPMASSTVVTATGWNLPRSSIAVDAPEMPGEVRLVSLHDSASGTDSNVLPFSTSDVPETAQKKPNYSVKTAQMVSLPIVVNGRIDSPGEFDVYKITGRKGETIVAETQARRLGSQLDSVVKLTDPLGNLLGLSDDFKDKGSGLLTDQADSYLTATLPGNGVYFVTVWDAQQGGGPEYGYRLRISEPCPDFDLRTVPSAIAARPGAVMTFIVYAIRRDGFSGDITLGLKDPAQGFTLAGGSIPGKADSATVTLKAPFQALPGLVSLSLEGTATVDGHNIVRESVPADDMMQAFAYRHLAPANEWVVAVLPRYKRPAQAAAVAPAAKPAQGVAPPPVKPGPGATTAPAGAPVPAVKAVPAGTVAPAVAKPSPAPNGSVQPATKPSVKAPSVGLPPVPPPAGATAKPAAAVGANNPPPPLAGSLNCIGTGQIPPPPAGASAN